jgi:transcriptional regulator with XRE-family HTH domain
MSQRQLAAESKLSLSLITKVEAGHAPATPSFLGAVARALRVDVPTLLGQPYQPAEPDARHARLLDTVPQIRRALWELDYPDDEAPTRTLAELTADVKQVSEYGQQAQFIGIGQALPTLLGDLSAAIQAAEEPDRARLNALLAEALSGASAVAGVLGLLDLRDRVHDHVEAASRVCDDPNRIPRVAWQRSGDMLGAGAYGPALRLMDRARAEFGDDTTGRTKLELSVLGSTYLRSSIVAARAAETEGDAMTSAAWDYVEAAGEIARKIGGDRNDYGLAFGPSNVAQHAVAVAVEMGDGVEALRRNRSTVLGPKVPPVRRSHHYIDVARAHVMEGDRASALESLQRARRVAPQHVRHHPMVRETVYAIADSAQRGTEDLTAFVSWLGIPAV